VKLFERRWRCLKTKLPDAGGRHTDTYAVAVNLVVVESGGSRPGRPVTYAAASRLDGIGRGAIGDMVSSAWASRKG